MLGGFACAEGPRSDRSIYIAPRSRAAADMQSGNRIDELVSRRLKELRISPAPLCSDAVFVRRVYLDTIGTLPTAREVTDFLGDSDPAKRSRLIENLFEREEFADYWAMKWCDILRVKAEFPSKLWPNAVQAYHRWLRDAIRDNMRYDRFARELLICSGSNFRMPPVNFYRAVQKREPASVADAVALTLMGQRTDRWPAKKREGMAAFFSLVGYKPTSEWKEEIVFFDLPRALSEYQDDQTIKAVFPDGRAVELDPGHDPRIAFVDWLTNPRNPAFSGNIVNRIWYWLMGRGIVHEPDDMRPDNPPRNPALLAWLQQELVKSGFDLRHIYRLILNSNTYQLSSIRNPGNAADDANFSHYLVRRLEAEVLIDAFNQITGTEESYSSEIPEPFTFIPEEHRAITLGDGSITSPFLDMFGRPPRDTGLESERNNQPSDTQALHLLNSSHIQRKMQRSQRLKALLKGAKWRNPVIIRRLYLTVLSRPPSSEEQRTATEYFETTEGWKMNAAIDLAWALINSKEFLYRH